MKSHMIHLQYSGTCCINNRIWFSNLGFNGLFSIDIEDMSVKYEHKIPFLGEAARAAYAHAVLRYDSKLLFFPNNCRQVFVYDVDNSSSHEIPMNLETSMEVCTTVKIVQIHDIVWIFLQISRHGVYTFNLSTLQMEHDAELSKLVESISDGTRVQISKRNEAEVAVFRPGDNRITVIDIEKKKEINHKFFEGNIKIQSIFYDKDSCWILQSDSTDIYEWNQIEDKLIQYCLTDAEWIGSERWRPYSNMIFFKDHIIVLPGNLKYIMKIDKATQTIKKAIDYPKGFDFLMNNGFGGWPAFSMFDVIDNKIWIHPILGNMLLIYDVENNYIEGTEITVTIEQIPYWQEIIEDKFRQGLCIEADNLICSLENFLDKALVSGDSDNVNQAISIGEKIYREVCEERW